MILHTSVTCVAKLDIINLWRIIMDVIDKEWLERVLVAARIYDSEHDMNTAQYFVQWLYKQYGIVFPDA